LVKKGPTIEGPSKNLPFNKNLGGGTKKEWGFEEPKKSFWEEPKAGPQTLVGSNGPALAADVRWGRVGEFQAKGGDSRANGPLTRKGKPLDLQEVLGGGGGGSTVTFPPKAWAVTFKGWPMREEGVSFTECKYPRKGEEQRVT